LSFIGHTTDSLWSVDLFRSESIVLRSYWVLVVMDQFTRRLVGIGVQCGAVSAADVCRMFNAAIHRQDAPRKNSKSVFAVGSPLKRSRPQKATVASCATTTVLSIYREID
jgi:transposase InsO family protein